MCTVKFQIGVDIVQLQRRLLPNTVTIYPNQAYDEYRDSNETQHLKPPRKVGKRSKAVMCKSSCFIVGTDGGGNDSLSYCHVQVEIGST